MADGDWSFDFWRHAGQGLGVLCLVATGVLAIAWGLNPIAHDDVFWHLRTGDWIVAHHAVPLVDPFSYTRLGERWISHEWGFALIVWLADRLAGLDGLLVLAALLLLLIGELVRRRAVLGSTDESADWALLGALLALGLLAMRGLTFLRPALLGEACFAGLLLALDRYRVTGRRRMLVAAVAIIWGWANLHSGVLFGLFVLGLQAAEAVAVRFLPARVGARFPLPEGAWRALPVAAVVAVGLSLCNPNGYQALLFPFILGRWLFASGIAWDLAQFRPYTPTSNLPLVVLLCLVLWGLLRGRRGAVRPWELVAIAVFFALTFRASRSLLDLVLLLVPSAYRLLRVVPREAPRRAHLERGALASLALALALLALPGSLPAWPLRPVDSWLPIGAARFLEQNRISGHLFNHANYGGYLLWALHQPVFWDGRNDVFAPLTKEVTTTPFPRLVERYGIDVLVLTEREYDDLREEVEGPRWALVYWDDPAAVYLRRDRFAPRLPALELHTFHAFSSGGELRDLLIDPARAAAAAAELERLLAVYPENQRALYLAGVLAAGRRDLDAARRDLEAAQRLGDNPLQRRLLAAVYLDLGRRADAARLWPGDPRLPSSPGRAVN